MDITFAPRGILQIDGARMCFRQFSGEPGKYNREGDKNFALIIPDEEIADRLIEDGWNVKVKDPRDEGDSPFMYLPIKVKFNDRGPAVYLHTGRRMNKLDEESVSCLDHIDILSADMDIRPYDWEVNGKEGRTAYLQALHVVQDIDRFEAMYAEEESPIE